MAIKVLLSLCWHFSHPVLIGFLLYGDLTDWEARTVTSVLLILSGPLLIFAGIVMIYFYHVKSFVLVSDWFHLVPLLFYVREGLRGDW